jgi:F-type H+-transporting ATPase subunit b
MDHRRLRWVVLVLVALAVVAWAAGPAWAAEGAGHAKEEKPGILSPRFDLGIWTIVVFALLLFVLRRFAWGPMLEGLRNREETIRGALDEAHRARDEAHRLRDQLQGEVSRAHEKVREILDEARRDAQHTTDEMLARTRAEIQTERDRLRREIDVARDQALQDLWNQAAQLATLISAKAIRRSLNPDDHRNLVEEAVAELRNAANQRHG